MQLKKKEKRANEEKRKAAEESFRNWVESKKERESQLEEELAGTKTHTGQKSPQKSKESGDQVWREWKEEKDRQDKLKLRKIKEEQLRWQKEQLEAKMKMIERAREIQERTRKRQELIARQRGLRLHASAVFPKSAKRKFGSGSVRVLGSTSLSSQGSSSELERAEHWNTDIGYSEMKSSMSSNLSIINDRASLDEINKVERAGRLGI